MRYSCRFIDDWLTRRLSADRLAALLMLLEQHSSPESVWRWKIHCKTHIRLKEQARYWIYILLFPIISFGLEEVSPSIWKVFCLNSKDLLDGRWNIFLGSNLSELNNLFNLLKWRWDDFTITLSLLQSLKELFYLYKCKTGDFDVHVFDVSGSGEMQRACWTCCQPIRSGSSSSSSRIIIVTWRITSHLTSAVL